MKATAEVTAALAAYEALKQRYAGEFIAIAAEAIVEPLKAEIARLQGYAVHKAGCGYRLTGGELVHNSHLRAVGQPELHHSKCTCGLTPEEVAMTDLIDRLRLFDAR